MNKRYYWIKLREGFFNSDEVKQKYMDCMDFAGKFSSAAAEKAAEMALSLDTLEDVSELAGVLTFPDK